MLDVRILQPFILFSKVEINLGLIVPVLFNR